MGRFSQKVQVFIFGISLGLLIGCLFFIFKLDDFFSKASLFEKENKAKVHEELVQENLKGASVELAPYLVGSIGNSTRIDYGTGHEASFICWICCLRQIEIVQEEDKIALVTKVFTRY